MLVLLIGRATNPDFTTGPLHSKLAVISEMIHTASLIHNDVLEEDETDTSQGTLVHQEVALEVGNKVCILAGDFLLAKAAVELSLLECSPVTAIVARGLEAICEGGMQAFRGGDSPEGLTLEDHLEATGASVGELIGNSCQCSAILSGHEPDSTIARACHQYGYNLAMARELMKEADELDGALRKIRRNPEKLRDTLPSYVRVPILKAAETYPEVRQLLAGSTSPKLAAMLERAGAVQMTRELAAEHAQVAADALGVLPNSATRDALIILCHKVITGTPLK
jgi:geranylgeranyl pyrophosphate synthase